MKEYDDPKTALEVADWLTRQTGEKYTVTGGVNKVYAVRRQTPWEPAFMTWRRGFYREFGMVP